MPRTRPRLRCVATVLAACVPLIASAADACAARSGARTTPLVELYTSEGCSSCPPADRWLSAHVRDARANYLAFHVDYWDSIGWADRFASPAWSQRQRDRVSAAGSSAVFTPQVMVGERVQGDWRGSGAARDLASQSARPARAGLALHGARVGSTLDIVASAAKVAGVDAPANLWVASYVDAQASSVAAGENSGATLHHDRVVRKLYGPWPVSTATLTQHLVVAREVSPGGVIAFVQTPGGEVLQSLNLPFAGCTTR